MADATKKTIQTVRYEYELKSPTNAVEMDKALNWARKDLLDNKKKYDDAIKVEARDDTIVIYWEESAQITDPPPPFPRPGEGFQPGESLIKNG